MLAVSSLDDLQRSIDKIKTAKKNYYTNFYFDSQLFEPLFANDSLHIKEFGDSVFLFRKNNGFLNLYYFSNDLKMLENDLKIINSEHPTETFVLDIICKNGSMNMDHTITDAGFHQYISLVRMSRFITGGNYDLVDNSNLVNADENKLGQVAKFFNQYFDPFSERIPGLSELKKWANENQLFVFSSNGIDIQGFVIFEIKGVTSYLRYWFVHPEYRNSGIGSTLINKYFKESRNTRRQLFWVIETNMNAIDRYSNYGFSKEPLINTVYINREYTYEGKYN